MALLAAVTISCRGPEAPEQANTNQPVADPHSIARGPQNSAAPRLAGNYILAEVEHLGTINLIPESFATILTFMEDGTYARTSKFRGRADHNDTGEFRIEQRENGEFDLVLKPIFSGGKAAKDPAEKKHGLAFSPDLEELRLTGSDGKVALFRRSVAPPQAPPRQ